MMPMDVVFKYGMPPSENEIRAVSTAREVYGIRNIKFNEKESTVRVEYDGTRLSEATVAALLRRAGLDVREKIRLV